MRSGGFGTGREREKVVCCEVLLGYSRCGLGFRARRSVLESVDGVSSGTGI